MGFDRQLGNIEEQIIRSDKKIEDLAFLVQRLTQKTQAEGQESFDEEILSRIETRLEDISKFDTGRYYEYVASELRKSFDERQKYLSAKIVSIEELVVGIGEYINKKSLELDNENDTAERFDDLKDQIASFSAEIFNIKREFINVEGKIEELLSQGERVENIQNLTKEIKPLADKLQYSFETGLNALSDRFIKLSDVVDEIDYEDNFSNLKSDIDSISISLNALMSAIQLVEFKYKDIQEGLDKSAKSRDIQPLQLNVATSLEKIEAINEIIKLLSTSKEIESLKEEIGFVSHSIGAFKDELNENAGKNEQELKESLDKLEKRFENALMLLADTKAGSTEVAEKIIEVNKKLDNFQDILIKLLALDNVDLVKKDIREIFMKLGELDETLQDVANASVVDDVKSNVEIVISKVSDLKYHIDGSVSENIRSISNGIDLFNEKIDQIYNIASDRSRVDELKSSVGNVADSIDAVRSTLTKLSVLDQIEYIKEKVDKFPENDEILTVKEDLNYLVGKVSSENDAIRGDLFSLQKEVSDLMALLPKVSPKEIYQGLHTSINDLESNLKQQLEETSETSSVERKQALNDIKNLITEVDKSVEKSSQELSEKVSGDIDSQKEELKNEIDCLKEKFIEIGTANFQKIDEIVKLEIENAIISILNKMGENKAGVLQEIVGISDRILEFLHRSEERRYDEIKEEFDKLLEVLESSNKNDLINTEIKALKTEFLQSLIDLENKLQNQTNEILAVSQDDAIKSELESVRSTLIKEFDELKNRLHNQTDQLLASGEDDAIRSELESVRSTLIKEFDELKNKLQNQTDQILAASQDDAIKSELESVRSTLEQEFDELKNKLQNQTNEILESSQDDAIKSELESIKTKIASFADDLNQLENQLSERLQDSKNKTLDKIKNDLESVKDSVLKEFTPLKTDLVSFKNRMIEELGNSTEQIENKISQNASDVQELEDVKDKIESVKQNILRDLDFAKAELVDKFSEIDVSPEMERLSEQFVEKFDSFKDEFSSEVHGISDRLMELLYRNEERQRELFESELGDFKNEISDLAKSGELQSGFESIHEKLEKLPNNDNIYSGIGSIHDRIDDLAKKEELVSNFSELKESVTDVVKTGEFQLEVSQLKETIESLSQLLPQESIKEDLKKVFDNIDENKKSVENEIKTLGEKLIEISSNFKQFEIEEVKSEFEKLKQDLTKEYNVSNSVILEKLNDTTFEDAVEGKTAQILDCIDKNKQAFNDTLQALDAKLDIVASSSYEYAFEEIKEFLQVIKDQIYSESELIRTVLSERLEQKKCADKTDDLVDQLNVLKESLVDNINGLGDRFLEFTLKQDETNFSEIRDEILKIGKTASQESDSEDLIWLKVELDNISQSVTGQNSKLTEELALIQTKFNELFDLMPKLALKDNLENELSDSDLKASIQELSNKLALQNPMFNDSDIAEFKNQAEELKSKILEEYELIKESVNVQLSEYKELNPVSIVQEVQQEAEITRELLNAKIDECSAVDLFAIIIEKIEEKELKVINIDGNAVKFDIDELKNDVKAIYNSFEELKNSLGSGYGENVSTESLQKIIDESKKSINFADDIQTIKAEINSLGDKFVMQMLQFFENVNFAEEAEDVKGFVAEAEDGIRSEISALKNFIYETHESAYNTGIESCLINQLDAIKTFSSKIDLDGEASLKLLLAKVFDAFNLVNQKINNLTLVKDIARNVDTLTETQRQIKNEISSIVGDIKILKDKPGFGLVKDKNTEFIYTMDDIQSDFAKMRLVLDEISKSVEKPDNTQGESELIERIQHTSGDIDKISQMLEPETTFDSGVQDALEMNFQSLRLDFQSIMEIFEKLNEEVADISMRTNKLILTSEDNNKVLKNNLAEFKDVITRLDESNINEGLSNISFSLNSSVNTFDKKFGEIKSELNKVGYSSQTNMQSAQIIKEALMYFGEWIDSAGGALEELCENVNEIKNSPSINDEIKSIVTSVESFDEKIQNIKSEQLEVDFSEVKQVVNEEIEKISQKVESYDQRLSSIEEKLDKLTATEEKDDEIRSILEFIASQASAASENSKISAQLASKMEQMEEKMNSFDKNINKLVEFVDED